MRYEAKHNHLKKLAQNIGNFINIARTLESRHQYWECYKWQEGDLLADDPEIGPGMLRIYTLVFHDLLHWSEFYFKHTGINYYTMQVVWLL